MYHPNPYLFQINRLDGMLVAEWMFQQVVVRAAAGCYGFQGHIYYTLEKMSSIIFVRTHVVVNNIHSKFYCCIF
jgi:hypothetical protein